MTLKDLERAWRRFWIGALTRLMRRGDADRPPEWGTRPFRVLFLRHDRIGDMILSTGVLRAIAGAQPGLVLDVLASPINAPVLAHEPAVTDVVVFDRKRLRGYPALVRRLRRARYDVVVDCMVTYPSLTTLLLMWASGARWRVGVAGRGNDAAFNLTVPPLPWARHISEHIAALVAAFGIVPTRAHARPRLAITDAERAAADAAWQGAPRGARLLVNVSAGTGNRRWPDAHFVAVLRQVRARAPHMRILVVGAPSERARVQAVAGDAGAEAVETRGIRDALALVATADYVFTPDTSIAHAASAFGTAAVAMHAAGSAERWALLGANVRDVSSPDGTLAALPLPPVMEAVERMLEGGSAA